MVTHIFGNPADSNYATKLEEHMTSVRRLASSDLISALTSEQLPTTLIQDTVYLGASEIQLLADLSLTVDGVNAIMSGSDDIKKLNVQYMLIVGIVIKMLPQIIQIVSERTDEVTIRSEEIDWQKKEIFLRNEYNSTITKIAPGTTTVKGTIGINVAQTSSRAGD